MVAAKRMYTEVTKCDVTCKCSHVSNINHVSNIKVGQIPFGQLLQSSPVAQQLGWCIRDGAGSGLNPYTDLFVYHFKWEFFQVLGLALGFWV